jgi:hypothetical protein
MADSFKLFFTLYSRCITDHTLDHVDVLGNEW